MTTTTKYPYVSDWRTANGLTVHRYSILTTDRVIYAAYEARNGHASWMTGPDGEALGQLMSRPLPAEVAAIPVGEARYEACKQDRAKNAAESFAAILAAYPEARDGTRDGFMGEIETTLAVARGAR
jgi:hypothetical protein